VIGEGLPGIVLLVAAFAISARKTWSWSAVALVAG
jgi:hypothetical protein